MQSNKCFRFLDHSWEVWERKRSEWVEKVFITNRICAIICLPFQLTSSCSFDLLTTLKQRTPNKYKRGRSVSRKIVQFVSSVHKIRQHLLFKMGNGTESKQSFHKLLAKSFISRSHSLNLIASKQALKMTCLHSKNKARQA